MPAAAAYARKPYEEELGDLTSGMSQFELRSIVRELENDRKGPQLSNEYLGYLNNLLGLAYRHLQEWDKAAQSYRRAMVFGRSERAPRLNLGQMLYARGEYNEAIKALLEAKKLPGGHDLQLF